MKTTSLGALVAGAVGMGLAAGCSSPAEERTESTASVQQALLPCDPTAPFNPPVPSFTGTRLVDGITFTQDYKRAYFSGRLNGATHFDLYMTERADTTAPFTVPASAVVNLNTTRNERMPMLTPDGGRLYFGKRINSYDIWTATIDAAGAATQVQALPSSAYPGSGTVNVDTTHEQDPFFLSGANKLFYAKEPQENAPRKLYSADFNPGTGAYTNVQTLASNSYDEYHPVLSSDGLTLYFSSTRPSITLDTGGHVFTVKRASTAVAFDLSQAKSIPSLESSRIDYPVALSPDGCTLYFASNRDTLALGDYRLYQTARSTTVPTTVTTTLKIVGTGSVTVAGYPACSATCNLSGDIDDVVNAIATTQAVWSGSCTPGGGQGSTDGYLMFTNGGTCTVTFGSGQSPAGGGCINPNWCESGLECNLNVCGPTQASCPPNSCGAWNGVDGYCPCDPGEVCTTDANCTGGAKCCGGTCGAAGCQCTTWSQCAAGLECSSGTCVNGPPDVADEDCDGMADALERLQGLDPADPQDSSSDIDGDGLTAADELRAGGDPNVADTDSQGAALLASRDLDGDGFVLDIDNCPDDVNPSQFDTDGDGIGDQCDVDPASMGLDASTVALHVAVNSDGDHAVVPAALGDSRRRAADQKGMVPTGTSFRLLALPVPGTVELSEYYRAATGSHAYAVGDAEAAGLAASGFELLGAVGSLGVAPLAFGESVLVRRFTKGSGGTRRDAVTSDADEADRLVAAGYVEVQAVGYGLSDRGKVRQPKAVVRYREPATGAVLHTAIPRSGPLEFESDGFQFGVLPEKNGWTVPLRRLRNATGSEVLSSDPAELPSLAALGYQPEGLVGFVYASPSADTLEHLVSLVRVRRGSDYRASADPGELSQLRTSGFGDDVTLGYAVRVPTKRVTGLTCAGAQNPLQKMVDAATADNATLLGNAAVLYSLNQAVTLKRVAAGIVETPTEAFVEEAWALTDPQDRLLLLAHADQVLAVDSAERATLLGTFAQFDPGDAGAPVDHAASSNAIQVVLRAGEFVPGIGNGGVTPDLTSLARIRAAQCEGVLYDSNQPQGDGAAAKAVTIRENQTSEECPLAPGETCFDKLVSKVTPVLYGVKRGPSYSPVPAVNAYADEHRFPESGTNNAAVIDVVGMPLVGIDVGPCTPNCAAVAGQRCSGDRCRAYPIVPNGASVSFSGSNLWDVKTARIRLTEVESGFRPPDAHAVIDIRASPPAEAEKRCATKPVVVDRGIRASSPGGGTQDVLCLLECPVGCFVDNNVCVLPPNDDGIKVACTPQVPRCPDGCSVKQGQCVRPVPIIEPNLYQPLESEPFIEHAAATVATTPGLFYEVQFINVNGSYFRLGDPVPNPGVPDALLGRTVHLCTAPGCEPPPDPDAAACALSSIPACGGAVGGIWNTPPRSLEQCRQMRDPNDPEATEATVCPETPFQFVSPSQIDEQPLLIFVAEPEIMTHIQTRLIGVQCKDETGGDALGSDELVVHFSSLARKAAVDETPRDEIANYEAGHATFTADMDAGDRIYPNFAFNTLVGVADTTQSAFLVEWGEDDFTSGWVGLLTLPPGVGAGFGFGSAVSAAGTGASVGAGIVGGGASWSVAWLALAYLEKPDTDDFIGRGAWVATAGDVIGRGALAHQGGVNPVSPLTPVPSANTYVAQLNVSSHPSVDLGMYSANSQAAANTCSPEGSSCLVGGPIQGRCELGVCVGQSWKDRSVPLSFDTTLGDAPGTIEERKYRVPSNGAKYDGFISSSISAPR